VNSCFAPKDLFKATSEWNEEQRSVVVELGLSGLLELDNILFVNRDFSQWLLQRVDTQKGVLKIGRNEFIYLSQLQVSSILGIRYGGAIDITRSDGHPTSKQIQKCRFYLGIGGSSEEITVTELVSVLMKKYSSTLTEADKTRLKVGYVMLCCTVFLVPGVSVTWCLEMVMRWLMTLVCSTK
jgi:hypothetical protein